MSTSAKDDKDVSKKADREATRLLQNDQEKQRKEKIKSCIGEIAKELPPNAEHIDRKPSTLSIVSQAKEYIRKLKEQNSAYERNEAAEQQQEELKRLRQAQADQIEKIRQLEETLKTYAIEKVVKKNSDHHGDVEVPEPESLRRRPKTINKLLEKQEQLHQQQRQLPQHVQGLDSGASLPVVNDGDTSSVGSGGLPGGLGPHSQHHHHTGGVSTGMVGSASNSTLPPSSLMSPLTSCAASSSISIMTVAPTILSVKSPSVGQARGGNHLRHQANGSANRTTNNSINSSSSAAVTTVVGSSVGGRINTLGGSSSVSYLDVIGGADFVNSLANGGDGGNLILPTAPLSASVSQLTCTSSSGLSTLSSAIPSHSALDLHQQAHSTTNSAVNCNNSTVTSIVEGLQGTADLPLLQNHPGTLAGSHPILNFNSSASSSSQATEICVTNASALQTLASVATSSHMVGSMQPPSSINSGDRGAACGTTTNHNLMASGMSLGLAQTTTLGQQQQPMLSLSNADIIHGLPQNCKQVIFNGQVMTLADQDPEYPGASTVPQGQQSLTLGPGGLQANNLLQAQQHNQGSLNLGGTAFPSNQSAPNSNIFTLNEHGQLVPLQPHPSQMNQAPTVDLSGNPASNILTNLAASGGPLGGAPNLLPSSIQGHMAHAGTGFPPIVSQCGPGSQTLTLLPGTQGNSFQPQLLQNGQILLGQQPQQVLNLGGLGGMQVINPLQGMVLNSLAGPTPGGLMMAGNTPLAGPAAGVAPTLNGATVKLVGNELKLVGPGDTPLSSQTSGGGAGAGSGPTHVMVDGSLIPISTNPQTIVPPGSALPLSTVVGAGKPPQQLSLGANSVLQFDPSNPGAAPILINAPAQAGPLQLGHSSQLQLGMPAAVGAPSSMNSSAGGFSFLHQLSSSASAVQSLQSQLGPAAVGANVLVASTMVTSTLTTNALSSCISSPSVSASSNTAVVSGKGVKGLPHLVPALTQTTQGSGSSSSGPFPSILPSALPQQFIINGQKVIAPPAKFISSSTSSSMPTPKTFGKGRKNSSGVSRASPIATAEVSPQIIQRGFSPSAPIPALSPGRSEKVPKSKSKKQSSQNKKSNMAGSKQEGTLHKADLLAQATATAGISMEGETASSMADFSSSVAGVPATTIGPMNNSGSSGGIVTATSSTNGVFVKEGGKPGVFSVAPVVASSSSTSSSAAAVAAMSSSQSALNTSNISTGSSGSSDHQLQIHIKSPPVGGVEEDDADNVQLIIDENCGGISSISPGVASVGPNLSTFSPPFSLKRSGATSNQQLLLQAAAVSLTGGNSVLSPPLVSPTLVIHTTASHSSGGMTKLTANSAITTKSTSSLSPYSSSSLTPFSTSSLTQLPAIINTTPVGAAVSAAAVVNPSQITMKSTTVTDSNTNKDNLPSADLLTQLSSAIVSDCSSGKSLSTIASRSSALGTVTGLPQSTPISTLTSKSLAALPMTALSVSTTISPTVAPIYTDISPPSSGSSISPYVPLTPALPRAQGLVSSALTFGQDFGFGDPVIQALIGPPTPSVLQPEPAAKGKPKGKGSVTMSSLPLVEKISPVKTRVADSVLLNSGASKPSVTPSLEKEAVNPPKKKSASKKKKTKAELRLEKEEREKAEKEAQLSSCVVDERQTAVGKPKLNSSVKEDSLLPVLEVSADDEVKERIMHSVSESKLLGSDGNQISLMDMVDKLEIFTSATSTSSPFSAVTSALSVSTSTPFAVVTSALGVNVSRNNVGYAMAKSTVATPLTLPEASNKATVVDGESPSAFKQTPDLPKASVEVVDHSKLMEKPEKLVNNKRPMPPKRESARRRKVDNLTKEPSPPRLDCKRTRKGVVTSAVTTPSTTGTVGSATTESNNPTVDLGHFTSFSPLTGVPKSDVYDFVDEEPGSLVFNHPVATPVPTKSPVKKTMTTRRGRSSKVATVTTASTTAVSVSKPELSAQAAITTNEAAKTVGVHTGTKPSNSSSTVTHTIMTRSEAKNANQRNNSGGSSKRGKAKASESTETNPSKQSLSPVSVAIPPSTLSLATMVSPISLGSPLSAATLSSPTLSTSVSASLASLSSFPTVPKSPPLFASTPTKPSSSVAKNPISSSTPSVLLGLDSTTTANNDAPVTSAPAKNSTCGDTTNPSESKKDEPSKPNTAVSSGTSSAITPTTTNSLASTLEESFSMPMDFQQVMDFHNPPKLTGDPDTGEDPDNSMGLPGGDTLADFFSQNSPGKIMLAASPPNLHNGVLSPSVEIPALRTPAPPPLHNNQDDHGLMLEDNVSNEDSNKNFVSPSNDDGKKRMSGDSKQQSMSRMHTPPPLETKSPGGVTLAEMGLGESVVSLSSQAPTSNLSLPATSSPPLPPPLSLSSHPPSMGNSNSGASAAETGNSINNATSSCMKSSSHNLHHHHHHEVSAITASNPNPSTLEEDDAPMPSLSTSSLDALSDILPLKPITSEIEDSCAAVAAVEAAAAAAAAVAAANAAATTNSNQGNLGDHSTQPMPCGMGQMQQQQQQRQPTPQQQLHHQHLEVQQQQQQQQQQQHMDMQQRQNPLMNPQSSPHTTLRPPSASNTPLPSPKHHASPGSASNAGSVHSMSPAAQQQQQQHHSCHKQQQQQQQQMITPGVVPPLSHPPQHPSPSMNQMFSPVDSSPRNANFASPPSGSNLKLKHMSPSSSSVHSTPEHQQQQQINNQASYMNSQKPQQQQQGAFSQTPNTNQAMKKHYPMGDKIGETQVVAGTSSASRIGSDNFTAYNNMSSGSNSVSPGHSAAVNIPSISSNDPSGFSFSLSSNGSNQQQSQPSSCSANLNKNSSGANSMGDTASHRGAAALSQPVSAAGVNLPLSSHPTHSSPYRSPFFPTPPHPSMNLSSIPPHSASSSSPSVPPHHGLGLHPLGNMEIQHPFSQTMDNSGGPPYGMIGAPSLMSFSNPPKLDIPPIAKSPTYNTNNSSGSSSGSNNQNSNTSSSNNTAGNKSPASSNFAAGSSSKEHGSSSSSSSNRGYQGSSKAGASATAESIYQQQQKRPNTIQHPPAGLAAHMDPMVRLGSLQSNGANNSSAASFFGMGFPTPAPSPAPSSLTSASMPLRHLPDTNSSSTATSRYNYPTHLLPPSSHHVHSSMGFPHPHSQLPSAYGAHSFTSARDCARADSSHLHHQQQSQQQQQQQQQHSTQQHQAQQQQQSHSQPEASPRKQSSKKSSSSSSSGGSHRGSSNSNNSNSSSSNTAASSNHNHSPATSSSSTSSSSSSSRAHASNSSSSSSNSSHSNRSSNSGGGSSSSSTSGSQKRKATSSSSSSSKKKSTGSQHTGYPAMDTMDTTMTGANMFEPSLSYFNFPTFSQSMSPPAARPHHQNEAATNMPPPPPFLGGMFNPPASARPISNSSASAGSKAADMAASHFPLFHTRSPHSNSFFQAGGFGMNSMTGQHPAQATHHHHHPHHSMGMSPHMTAAAAFGLFAGGGNDTASACAGGDNINIPQANKFLHQGVDHSGLQHGAHQTTASLYHSRPHSAQPHMMAAFYPHSFDSRSHMQQAFNSSMGPPPHFHAGLPPINFPMHDTH